jgi:hypothetical protein
MGVLGARSTGALGTRRGPARAEFPTSTARRPRRRGRSSATRSIRALAVEASYGSRDDTRRVRGRCGLRRGDWSLASSAEPSALDGYVRVDPAARAHRYGRDLAPRRLRRHDRGARRSADSRAFVQGRTSRSSRQKRHAVPEKRHPSASSPRSRHAVRRGTVLGTGPGNDDRPSDQTFSAIGAAAPPSGPCAPARARLGGGTAGRWWRAAPAADLWVAGGGACRREGARPREGAGSGGGDAGNGRAAPGGRRPCLGSAGPDRLRVRSRGGCAYSPGATRTAGFGGGGGHDDVATARTALSPRLSVCSRLAARGRSRIGVIAASARPTLNELLRLFPGGATC